MSLEKKSNLEDTFLVTFISAEFAEKEEKTINECFWEEIKKADRVEISVAYCSCDSLQEVDLLVERENIKNVSLILGMYFFIGFSESLHEVVIETNEKWQKEGMGEIRPTDSFKYHGKLYCFYKDDQISSAIIGSPNLSFLITKENKKSKQYEIAELIRKPSSLNNYQRHIKKLKSDRLSKKHDFSRKI